MDKKLFDENKEIVRKYIEEHCIFNANPNEHYFGCKIKGKIPVKTELGAGTYQFFLKRLMYNPEMLERTTILLCDLLVKGIIEQTEFDSLQLCGLESASIPLIISMQQTLLKSGILVNGFTVRKERKNYGLHNIVEGIPQENIPVAVIDDITNSLGSVLKCLDVSYKILNLRPAINCYSIVNLKNKDIIDYGEYKVKVKSLFELKDFSLGYDKEKYWRPLDCAMEMYK